jgi:hypothetical protein
LSDALARLSSGAGWGTRELHTDLEEVLFNGSRPIIINSITDIVGRPDLADRCMIITLERIDDTSRRAEEEMLAKFEAARPGILGALLDTVSQGLRELPRTTLAELPRMADFAVWATACEREKGAFMRAYNSNRDDAVEIVLEDDIIAQAVRELLALQDPHEWDGTATELLKKLNERADENTKRAKDWPARPNALSGRLRRAAPPLRKVEVNVDFYRDSDTNRTRKISLYLGPPKQKTTEQHNVENPVRPNSPDSSAKTESTPPCAHCGRGTEAGALKPWVVDDQEIILHDACCEPWLATHKPYKSPPQANNLEQSDRVAVLIGLPSPIAPCARFAASTTTICSLIATAPNTCGCTKLSACRLMRKNSHIDPKETDR